MFPKKKTYQRGILAERIAQIFLMLKGHRILEKRWKSYYGEIDLVTKRGSTYHFIEVKYRKSKKQLDWAISAKQRKRIRNAAEFYLQKTKNNNSNVCQFDVVFVSKLLIPKYIKNLDF